VSKQLDVANLESEMYLHWRSTQTHGGVNVNNNQTNSTPKVGGAEMTFTNMGGNNDGGGHKCWKCGSTKHVKAKCPQVSNAERNQTSGGNSGGMVKHCKACGKTGHEIADCYSVEANAHKRPAWYKPRGET
jgi:hypothetical protein